MLLITGSCVANKPVFTQTSFKQHRKTTVKC